MVLFRMLNCQQGALWLRQRHEKARRARSRAGYVETEQQSSCGLSFTYQANFSQVPSFLVPFVEAL